MAYQLFSKFSPLSFFVIGPYMFFIVNWKNIKFKIKEYQITFVLNLMIK